METATDVFADLSTTKLKELERRLRQELRDRAVAELTEVPRPTPEEFELLKTRPDLAMRSYRLRTGLGYHATGGVFQKLYRVRVH
jgi:hypothetical protein